MIRQSGCNDATRLFNENYFAFRAALDDACTKGIRHVALPGDYSDDAQPINIDGIAEILKEYKAKDPTVVCTDQLMAFSHYPAMDFYANQTDAMKAVFKAGAFQTARVPEAATKCH